MTTFQILRDHLVTKFRGVQLVKYDDCRLPRVRVYNDTPDIGMSELMAERQCAEMSEIDRAYVEANEQQLLEDEFSDVSDKDLHELWVRCVGNRMVEGTAEDGGAYESAALHELERRHYWGRGRDEGMGL